MTYRSRLLRTVLPFALAAFGPGAAWAEVRALLVGVSDYHALDVDLRGPANDVRLLSDALLARGADPARVRVLAASGTRIDPALAPAEDPTRAAILDALDRLAAEARPGDTVIFYFSGHGSQAPDINGDEGGGYDEILLPSDAAGWRGAIGAVENAIVDDELQVKMQAILDTGAELVGIIDACHSATGFRAVGGAGVARYVAPRTLGIPDAAPAVVDAQPATPLSGQYAFLYSSQSDERSFEYPLGDPDDPANWFGDFTRNLVAVLQSQDAITWRQALAASADGLHRGKVSQTPDGEGPGLDRPVFGAASAAPDRLRVEAGRLMAGMLDGIDAGAVLAIYDRAVGGERLGTVTVARADASAATLSGGPALPALAYAEPLQPGVPAAVRVGRPVAVGTGHAGALDAIARIAEAGLADGVEWTEADPDLWLLVTEEAVAVVGRDGLLDPAGPGSSPRIPADAAPDVILNFIDRAARVERLRTALARAEGRKSLGMPGAGLTVSAARVTADGCEAQGPAEPLADGAQVRDCDEIWLTLQNRGRTAQDVTVLYIDRDLNVVAIWPEAGLSNRVGFNETAEVGMMIHIPDGRPGGIEEIVVISVPAREGAPRTVLTGLADPAAMRDTAPASAVGAYLMAAATGDTDRVAGPVARTESVKVTRLRVVLAAGDF